MDDSGIGSDMTYYKLKNDDMRKKITIKNNKFEYILENLSEHLHGYVSIPLQCSYNLCVECLLLM